MVLLRLVQGAPIIKTSSFSVPQELSSLLLLFLVLSTEETAMELFLHQQLQILIIMGYLKHTLQPVMVVYWSMNLVLLEQIVCCGQTPVEDS